MRVRESPRQSHCWQRYPSIEAFCNAS
jgi:hypothetical protein